MLLYIHIPFCDSKCHYCSFNSYSDILHISGQYIEAIKTQLSYELDRFQVKKNSIETIFIGGGTPSCIEPTLYRDIFNILKWFLRDSIEITIEANPNSATKEWLDGIFELGVNRISFGVQSFDEKKLKFLGRAHSEEDGIKAIEYAYKSGFKDISLDLIYDTIMDTKELLKRDLDIAFSLPINHLSAYSLTIEKGTNFYTRQNLQSSHLSSWFIKEIVLRGFQQYEISNFGTYKSKHNLGYWSGKNYIGVGSGAVGFYEDSRFYPTNNVKKYIENPLYHKVERLSKKDLQTEKILLGLRSEIGVDRSILPDQKVELLRKSDKIEISPNRIYNRDFLLSDEIALFLMQD
jgi:oxygen-independent coproporphyrinogen-3 oxidase